MEGYKFCKWIFHVLDFMFACVVLTPLSMLWWAGTWTLMDMWIYPEDLKLSGWITFVNGSVVCYVGFFILPPLQTRLTPGNNWRHLLVSRIFVYLYGTGQLSFWRGVWELMDAYFGYGLINSSISLVVAETVLLLLRGASNNMGPPFFLLLDNREDFYHTYPRFRTKFHDNIWKYSSDCLFTVMVMGTCIVLVWRGIWNVTEDLILPDDELTSCLICLGVGIFLAILLHCLQTPCYLTARYLATKSKLAELLFEDLVIVFATISSLMIWRGGVDLMEDAMVDKLPFALGAHALGAGGLLLLNAGSNMAVVGCSIDAEEGEGKDILWPMNYLSAIVESTCPSCILGNESENLLESEQTIWEDFEQSDMVSSVTPAPYDNMDT